MTMEQIIAAIFSAAQSGSLVRVTFSEQQIDSPHVRPRPPRPGEDESKGSTLTLRGRVHYIEFYAGDAARSSIIVHVDPPPGGKVLHFNDISNVEIL
jgi:hypothetical protein